MQIRITKGRTEDHIAVRRSDGSEVATRFPKKGPIPHDAVHLAVERTLGLEQGFWGMVASGRHPEDIAGLAKAAGHASASRGTTPDRSFVQAIQAERAVEAFEADHWAGGAGDPAGIRHMTDAGCGQSQVPRLQMDDAEVAAIRAELADFARRWSSLPEGGSIEMTWPE